jgi:hypothetical protein
MKVVASGMIRSASTWQYNLLRIIMEQAGLEPQCFWVNDYKGEDGNVLIKTHEFHSNIVEGSIIFTALRSEEGIKGSMRRRAEYLAENPDNRFNGTASLDRYPKYFKWFKRWRDIAHYRQNYDEVINNPLKVINDTIKVLGLTGKVFPDLVLQEINDTKPTDEYNAKTMYHPFHVTKDETIRVPPRMRKEL